MAEMNITMGDFRPWNKWKEILNTDVVKANFSSPQVWEDQTTGRYYRGEDDKGNKISKNSLRAKCALLTIGS